MHSTKNYATVEISPSAPVTSVTSAFFFLLLDRGGKIRATDRKALLRLCLHGAGIAASGSDSAINVAEF